MEEYTPNYTLPDLGAPLRVLYVFNLPWDATNLELRKIFAAYLVRKVAFLFLSFSLY